MGYGSIARSEKPISRVVLGTMALAAGRLPFSFSLLDAFVESGGTCIDTAYVYGGGSCEKAAGAWFTARGNREQIYLVGKSACTTSCTPDLIARELHESLERMQTHYMDLYFMHRDNIKLPVSEFVECLNEHLRAGRMRAFGGSNWTPARLAEANAYAAERGLVGFAASSPNFSLALWNEPMWPDCMTAADLPTRRWYEESGLPLFAWSSQASGFFTGRFKAEDRATADPEVVRTWFNEDNFRRLDRARELADKYGVTTTQVALAYVLCQPALDIYALIGPRTVEELRSSLEALSVRLSPDELAYLNLEQIL